jgi:hypothetical protein
MLNSIEFGMVSSINQPISTMKPHGTTYYCFLWRIQYVGNECGAREQVNNIMTV